MLFPDGLLSGQTSSVETPGQQVQTSVMLCVAVHGVGSLHVAEIVTIEPHPHFEDSVAVHVVPEITARPLLPATLGPQSTCIVIELLLQFATEPLTEI